MHCLEYGKDLARGSPVTHRQTKHGVSKGVLVQEGNKEGGVNNPRMFRMAIPEKAVPRPCPVEEFSGRLAMWTAMQVHFWHRHAQYTVVILEERNLPHQRCSL